MLQYQLSGSLGDSDRNKKTNEDLWELGRPRIGGSWEGLGSEGAGRPSDRRELGGPQIGGSWEGLGSGGAGRVSFGELGVPRIGGAVRAQDQRKLGGPLREQEGLQTE